MISFIVPAFNEEQLLGRTLRAIKDVGGALGHPYEVVVVDDASTDRTVEIAEENGARVISVDHRQIAATRNSGARAAEGGMLFFVDADTVVNEAAVRAGIEAMQAGAVGGGCQIRFDGRVPVFGRVLVAMTMPVYRLLGLATGCFLFCTREAFFAAGGFDEAYFGAEEVVLSRALRRQGPFLILRQAVVTSARKLRAYSALEIMNVLTRLALRGRRGVRQRAGLEIWYGPRREDPEAGD